MRISDWSSDVCSSGLQVPGFHDALQVGLVEISPALRERQREALGSRPVAWLDNVGQIPDTPLLLIANEFFDALPVRQFEQTGPGGGGGWAERVVVLDGSDNKEGGRLAFGLAAPSPANRLLIPAALRDAPEGSLAEVSPAALNIAAFLGHRLADRKSN